MTFLAVNKQASHDYEILEKVEAGVVLVGWEVKAIKNNQVSLKSAFVREKNGELFLFNAKVGKWKYGYDIKLEEENRNRKLLLKKKQILNLSQKVKEKGLTIIPLDIYINNEGIIKITLGLGKGRKKYDKRQKLKEKDLKKRIEGEKKLYKF